MSGTRVLHYEILRPLGRGGMGEVVEAVDSRLGRHVALKFVAAELATDAAHRERFEREARAAAGLTHPNIAVVHAFESDGGRMFLVMELLSGRTLRALLADGPLPVPQAVRIARELASALAFAHGKSIHHRDVKPENVMFDEHGAAKLMDFGLAHAANTTRLTRTNTTLGTPAYMAPEAIAGKSVPASDVFALGVLLHEMLAGSLPFPGDNAMAVMYAITNLPARSMLEARPETGEALAGLLARMLAKEPEPRITAAQAVRELDELLGMPTPVPVAAEGETQAVPMMTPGAHTPGLSASTVEARTLELNAEHRAPVLPAVTTRRASRPRPGLVLLVLVLAAVWPVWRWRSNTIQSAHLRAIRLNDAGTEALLAHDLASAEARFDSSLAIEPRLWVAQVGRAALEAEKGDRAAAAARLQRVLDEAPANEHALRATAWSHLAELAISDGNWGDAVKNLYRAFAEDSSDVGAYNQLGFALINFGASAEAAHVLDRGLVRFPAVAALHKNAGLAALANGDAKRAEDAADQALARDPGYMPAYSLRARARARLGNRDGAASDALRFLTSSPLETARIDEVVQDLGLHGITLRKDAQSGVYRVELRGATAR